IEKMEILLSDTDTYTNLKRNPINKVEGFFTIPYVPHIFDNFKRFFKGNQFIRLAYMGINKLSAFIKCQKDKLSTFSRSNVVYKINCQNCDASYIGQTKRLLKIRIP
ncbi:hypothetical protein ALC60_07163, partial [Trachymyrmex zeteki]